MEAQYKDMSLADLRALAKNKGVKSITTLRKQELIQALLMNDSSDEKNMGEASSIHKEQDDSNLKKETSKTVESVNTNVGEKKVNRPEIIKTMNRESQSKRTNITQQGNDVRRTNNTQQDSDVRRTNSIQQDSDVRRTTNTQQESDVRRTINTQQDSEINRTSGTQQDSDIRRTYNSQQDNDPTRNNNTKMDGEQLDSGETKVGILEVMQDGYGFIRCDNYLPGENDVYVSPAQIRRFGLKTGDIVEGNTRIRTQSEKFSALLYVKSVNGFHPAEAQKRKKFEELTPIFPNQRIHLETPGTNVSMRMVDLISPIGKGQRGMIVSQPKTGKTTLLKQIAKAINTNHPDMSLIILLIDERPEEVTDIKESIEGKNVEVIYSTFDELPENHKRVSEMVIERAKRLVEHKKDVVILLDSITRLARAYNLTVQASGRTLSGGLDPAALHMPKRFFGAARNMREGGSLTILATALVDTGSRMDDVVFEEFKGTGNMELVLDRNLSEKRIFPAIDLPKSSTRRDDLLLNQSELEATYLMRKALNGMKSDEAVERIIEMFLKTKTNNEFIETIKKTKIVF